MFLATTQELLEHFRYLRSSPSKAAALISPQADENSEQTKKLVLSQMKSEWELVLRLEGNPASACELHENCRYVSYHCFRELMAVWEKHAWTVHPEALSLTLAWYPEFAWSSNIESLFKEMTTAVKRSGQSDVGSLPNLMAVAIRGLHRRLCIGDESPQALTLEKEDWSGPQVSALKPKIFNPTSAPPCDTTATFFHRSHGPSDLSTGLVLSLSVLLGKCAHDPVWLVDCKATICPSTTSASHSPLPRLSITVIIR